jgi:antitoxin component YwqK of YwqJK toxin-antitoxin module
LECGFEGNLYQTEKINGKISQFKMNNRRASSQFSSVKELIPDEIPYLKKLGIKDTFYAGKSCKFFEYENILWIGSFDGDLPNGPGVLIHYEPQKVVLLTNMKKGIKDGLTKVYLSEELSFEVSIKRNLLEGNVQCINSQKKLAFKGTTLNGGQVKIVYPNGEVYIGEHFYFLRNGKGKLYRNDQQNVDNLLNDGKWEAGKFIRGHAKVDFYQGDVEDGCKQGHGILFYDKDCKYKRYNGNFLQDNFHGQGTEYNQDQSVRYTGFFLNGLFDGEGTLFLDSTGRSRLKGIFIAGKAHGKTDVYDETDRLTRKVYYENGDPKEVIEEYFYFVQLPSYSEISNEEVKRGIFETFTIEKVIAFHDLGSTRYFAQQDDLAPCFLGQLNSREFNNQYQGVLAEGGNLFYVGGFTKIFFTGEGVLRYNTKNEPKKYEGNFKDCLMDGQG